ncbi:hypothetical protein [Nocardia anaemiae]|uniref:hypothetical protein n=1 Tax=Nocardia anaemiae TaxID=263910 RepID=UPI000AA623A5|nr:hypothetical protein [Nocardia anaemiae]
MPKRRKQPRHKGAGPNAAIRYPRRSTLEVILPAMMAKRCAEIAHDPKAAKSVHLWGFAAVDNESTHDIGYLPVDLDTKTEESPILDAAGQLISRIPGRLWGFGLSYWAIGELLTGTESIPEDLLADAVAGRLRERPTADEICAATIFDARGHEYTSALYIHMPELGTTAWESNTLDGAESIRAWIDRFDLGVVSAHVWAAAIALDPDRNRNVLSRLRAHTSGIR